MISFDIAKPGYGLHGLPKNKGNTLRLQSFKHKNRPAGDWYPPAGLVSYLL